MQPTLPGVEESVTETTNFVEPATTPSSTATVSLTAKRDRPADAPFCYLCGNEMQRAGSCYVCSACGATSGCS